MRYLALAIGIGLVAGVVWLQLWHRKHIKAEKIRRSFLTAEELEQEDYDDWSKRQW